jgi:hypothetical protein
MEVVREQPDYNSIAEHLDGEPRTLAKRSWWSRLQARLNPLVMSILHSPIHALLSNRLMLVTVTGGRSETIYTLPVRYYELDALVIVLVPNAPGRSWWRNFVEPAYASITIRRGRTPARGFAPAPSSQEFAKAAERVLVRSRARRWLLSVELDRDKKLDSEQVEKLAEHVRIVIFDRTPPSGASVAPAEVALAAPEAETTTIAEAEVRLANLLGPLIAELEVEAHPAALALAARVAAERYRIWAREVRDTVTRKALEECSCREDDVASRAEEAVPRALAVQETIAHAHPALAAQYLGLFDGMSVPNQFVFQARLQRLAGGAWRSLAEVGPPNLRGALLECSYLEAKTAAALDTMIERYRTDPQLF